MRKHKREEKRPDLTSYLYGGLRMENQGVGVGAMNKKKGLGPAFSFVFTYDRYIKFNPFLMLQPNYNFAVGHSLSPVHCFWKFVLTFRVPFSAPQSLPGLFSASHLCLYAHLSSLHDCFDHQCWSLSHHLAPFCLCFINTFLWIKSLSFSFINPPLRLSIPISHHYSL